MKKIRKIRTTKAKKTQAIQIIKQRVGEEQEVDQWTRDGKKIPTTFKTFQFIRCQEKNLRPQW